jgi:hypothetical protein
LAGLVPGGSGRRGTEEDSGSMSLRTRVCIATGVNLLGYDEFFKRVYEAAGIAMPERTHHCLELRETQRKTYLERSQSKEYKVRRKLNYFEKLQEHALKAAKARARRDKSGVYESGIGMTASGNTVPAVPLRLCACTYCGVLGHVTKKSKHCLENWRNQNSKEVVETTEHDMLEQDLLDSLPCCDDEEDMVLELEELSDAVDDTEENTHENN